MHKSYLCIVASLFAAVVAADNVQYSVVAFPKDPSQVAVSVNGQTYPLSQSQDTPNLFTGSAPSGQNYQYVIDGNQKESTQRTLAQGATSTGNEFFGRSRTVYDVPALPQAYNPVYPTLFTGMNRSNEIATIIMQISNTSSLDNMLKNPTADNIDDVVVDQLIYIASNEVHKIQNATFKTSGQSTKDFAKQSYKVKFKGDQLLYGRSVVKLRAEETDMTMAREKLLMDCIAAAGGAVSSASWVRLYINNQPFGLYVMIDDASTHFIDNVLRAGDWNNPATGPTYKGNALSPQQEGNLAYLGDDPTRYSTDLYSLEDKGENKTLAKDELTPLIGFMKSLSQTQNISTLLDPQHTMIHMAFSFLSGSWDGFWYQASNYYLNQDLQTQKWTLITYDFDETLGNDLPDNTLMTVPYQQYGRPNSTRPVVEKILAQYSHEFEDILKTIIKRFFKPSVIGPRLEAWKNMLSEDIAWDLSLEPHSPGERTNWTVSDFQTNLFNTTKSAVGILEWVQRRSAAVCQQLNFEDNDDLPPLGPYTQGKYMDASGNISDKATNNANGNANSGSGNSANGQTSSASSTTSLPSFRTHSLALLLSFIALFNFY